jgi:hypothetical protein
MRTKRTKANKIKGFFASLFRFIAEKQKNCTAKKARRHCELRTVKRPKFGNGPLVDTPCPKF